MQCLTHLCNLHAGGIAARDNFTDKDMIDFLCVLNDTILAC